MMKLGILVNQMQHPKRRTLPFTSIVGQEDMKDALILNAIDPRNSSASSMPTPNPGHSNFSADRD